MSLRPLFLAALVAVTALPVAAQGTVTPVDQSGYEQLMAQRAIDAAAREAHRIANNIPQCVGNLTTTYCHYPDGTVEISHVGPGSYDTPEADTHVPFEQGQGLWD